MNLKFGLLLCSLRLHSWECVGLGLTAGKFRCRRCNHESFKSWYFV